MIRSLTRLCGLPRSNRVKERETPENVETRLVAGASFLRHALQYGQMRCRFRMVGGARQLSLTLGRGQSAHMNRRCEPTRYNPEARGRSVFHTESY